MDVHARLVRRLSILPSTTIGLLLPLAGSDRSSFAARRSIHGAPAWAAQAEGGAWAQLGHLRPPLPQQRPLRRHPPRPAGTGIDHSCWWFIFATFFPIQMYLADVCSESYNI